MGSTDSPLNSNAPRSSCGLVGSLFPTICRGRAEAFARRLHRRLTSLGAEQQQQQHQQQHSYDTPKETSWLCEGKGDGSATRTVLRHQPRRSSEDDLESDLEDGFSSPAEEVTAAEMAGLLVNEAGAIYRRKPPNGSKEIDGFASPLTGTTPPSDTEVYFDLSSDVTEGRYYDPESESNLSNGGLVAGGNATRSNEEAEEESSSRDSLWSTFDESSTMSLEEQCSNLLVKSHSDTEILLAKARIIDRELPRGVAGLAQIQTSGRELTTEDRRIAGLAQTQRRNEDLNKIEQWRRDSRRIEDPAKTRTKVAGAVKELTENQGIDDLGPPVNCGYINLAWTQTSVEECSINVDQRHGLCGMPSVAEARTPIEDSLIKIGQRNEESIPDLTRTQTPIESSIAPRHEPPAISDLSKTRTFNQESSVKSQRRHEPREVPDLAQTQTQSQKTSIDSDHLHDPSSATKSSITPCETPSAAESQTKPIVTDDKMCLLLLKLAASPTVSKDDPKMPFKQPSKAPTPEANDDNDDREESTPVDDDDDDDEVSRIPKIRRSSSLKTGKTPPGTPGRKKIVRFADVLGLDLADVRTFLDEIPRVPNSAYSDLIYDDFRKDGSPVPPVTAFDCRRSSVAATPRKPDRMLVPLFEQPGGLPCFLDLVRRRKVCLENVLVHDPLCLSVRGTVRVVNLDFHKSVHIRYTLNRWANFSDLSASYVANSCDGFTDKFSFVLSCHTLPVGQRLEFAVRFHCKGEQYWDNNDGENYCFQCLSATSGGSSGNSAGIGGSHGGFGGRDVHEPWTFY